MIRACLVLSLLAVPAGADEPAGIRIDKDKKAVVIDAKVAPRKLPTLDQIYPIEVIACWPTPKGKKAHETVVTIDVNPSDVHKALESVGLKPGKPTKGGTDAGEGPELKVSLEIPVDGGGNKKLSIHRFLVDPKTKEAFPKDVKFRFTGSIMSKPAPDKEAVYGADLTGTLIAVFPVTDETVCQTSLTMKEEKYLKLETDPSILPKEGTPVKLILEANGK